MDPVCNSFPVMAVAMYWSTLGVTLLGRALGRRWQERKSLRNHEEDSEESYNQLAEPMVVVERPAATANNANRTRKRPMIMKEGTNTLRRKSVENPLVDHPSRDATLRKRAIERIVAKRTVGSADFYKVKYLDCPESCNTWLRKPKIARRIIKKFEDEFLRHLDAPAISLPYPYGSKPDWPPIYQTRFGRSVYPTWKVVDGLMTERLLGWLKNGTLSVNGQEARKPSAARRHLRSRHRKGA